MPGADNLPEKGEFGTKTTHGMHAIKKYGRSQLDPTQIERLDELVALLATEPGRKEVRGELVARLAFIVDQGTLYVFNEMQQGTDFDSIGSLDKLTSFINMLLKALKDYPDAIDDALDVTPVADRAEAEVEDVQKD